MSNIINTSINQSNNLNKASSTDSCFNNSIPEGKIDESTFNQNFVHNSNEVNNEANNNNNDDLNSKFKSPRSEMALKLLGMTREELIHLTCDEFKSTNQDSITLPQCFPRYSRFKFYDSKKNQRSIDNSHWKDNDKDNRNSNNKALRTRNKRLSMNQNSSSSMIDATHKSNSITFRQDIKRLERVKNQNEREIMYDIQNGILKEILYKKIELQSQIETNKKKQKQYNTQLRLINEAKIKLQREKDLQALIQQSNQTSSILEIGNADNKDKDKANINRIKIIDQYIKQKAMNIAYIQQLRSKQTEISLRHKENNQQHKLKLFYKSMDIDNDIRERKGKIIFNRSINDMMLNSKQSQILQRQRRMSLTRELFELKQNANHIQKKEESLRRTHYFNKSLQIKLIERQQNDEDYFDYQRYLEDKRELNDLMKKEANEQRKMKSLEKTEEVYKAYIGNEEEIKEKNNRILEKLEEKEIKEQIRNEKKHMESMKSIENSIKKRMIKENRLRELSEERSMRLGMKLQKIKDKHMQVEEKYNIKMAMRDDILRMEREVSRKKGECKEKIEKIFRLRTFDENNIKELRELFPNKVLFNGLIDKLKRETNIYNDSNHNHTYDNNSNVPSIANELILAKEDKRALDTNMQFTYDNNNNNINTLGDTHKAKKKSNKSMLSQEEIDLNKKEKRKELNKQLDMIIFEEDIDEQIRKDRLKNAKNKKHKLLIEAEIEKERFEANKKIVELNNDIEKELIMLGISLKYNLDQE